MKPLNAWRLALVYAGCFLGAGYLSGQELWQFFGTFGVGGVWGLMLSALLQGVLCVVLLSLARRGDVHRVEHAVIRWERSGMRTAVGMAQLLLLFGVAVIMSAGAGALAEQMLGRGGTVSSLLFGIGVVGVSKRGVAGLVRVFSGVVPVLVVTSLAAAILTALRYGGALPDIPVPVGGESPLLTHWAVSAVSFVSCNLFGSIAVLIPLARLVPDRTVARRGAMLGAALLLLVACAILFAMYLDPVCVAHELPMLSLAARLHPAAGWCFAVLLLVAMFGTALSCTVAAQEYLSQKYALCEKHPTAVLLIFSALAFVGGLFGFGNLIGWVYPIFGYLGFVALCAVVAHERYLRRAEKKKEKT